MCLKGWDIRISYIFQSQIIKERAIKTEEYNDDEEEEVADALEEAEQESDTEWEVVDLDAVEEEAEGVPHLPERAVALGAGHKDRARDRRVHELVRVDGHGVGLLDAR